MSEIQYANREIDEKFVGVHDKLDLILDQTTKHNHRMSKLEAWRNYIGGAIAVLGVVGLPFVGLIYHKTQETSDKTIRLQTTIDALLRRSGINPETIIFNDR